MEGNTLAQILRGCKNGSSESFSKLVDAYAGRCYGYFYRLTGNRSVSDDLLSELFVRLVEKISSYKDGNFEAWLFKIASNIWHDYLRTKQREKAMLEAQSRYLSFEKPKPDCPDNWKIDKLQIELTKLDADTKELIMLRFYSQASFKEIAQMRSEPIGTTLSKLHRGLKRLRDLMGE